MSKCKCKFNKNSCQFTSPNYSESIIDYIEEVKKEIIEQLTRDEVKKSDITLLKTQSYKNISFGQIQTYNIVVTNNTCIVLENKTFSDTIPEAMQYVAGSFTINGMAIAPVLDKEQTLLHHFAKIIDPVEIEFKTVCNDKFKKFINQAFLLDENGAIIAKSNKIITNNKKEIKQ